MKLIDFAKFLHQLDFRRTGNRRLNNNTFTVVEPCKSPQFVRERWQQIRVIFELLFEDCLAYDKGLPLSICLRVEASHKLIPPEDW